MTELKKGPSEEFPTIQAMLGQTSKPMEGKQVDASKGMHLGQTSKPMKGKQAETNKGMHFWFLFKMANIEHVLRQF